MKAKHSLIHDTFTLERRYPSAPGKVYRYFSEPQYRKRWFGATEDWSQRSHSLDFRVGGQELEQGAPPGGAFVTYEGRFLDIVPGELFCTDLALYDTFNAVYRDYFPHGFPARAFLGASTLLRGAHYEVLGIAV